MSYYLGLDAGGTKTYAVIVDETGRVAERGRSGSLSPCGQVPPGRLEWSSFVEPVPTVPA